jgi:hypothetical protein
MQESGRVAAWLAARVSGKSTAPHPAPLTQAPSIVSRQQVFDALKERQGALPGLVRLEFGFGLHRYLGYVLACQRQHSLVDRTQLREDF